MALSSCSDSFLNRESLVALGPGTFWKTESDAQLGVNGIYDALQDRSLYSGTLNGAAGLPVFDNFGDNGYDQYKFEGPYTFMNGTIDPTHYVFSGLWISSYKAIGRANLVLQNVPNIPSSEISDAKKQEYLGQALFVRALCYFNLAVYFEDVPLVLNVQNLDEAYIPKSTKTEVMAQVVKDLQDAAAVLPNSYSTNEYGYATKGAALGLLARVDLYNKDYQGVLDATNAVMSLGYTLNPSYAQLFTPDGELSNEILFSVRFSENINGGKELFSGTYYNFPKVDEQPMPNMVKDYYCTDGKPITTSPLYNPTKQGLNRDPRCNATIYFKGEVFLVDQNKVFTGNSATTYGLKKYIRNKTTATGITTFSPAGQDFIVLRYADVLLMRAEALVELNQLGGVSALVDQVRARVNMPSVESVEGTGLSQTQLRAIVRHERRVELAFEGLRFMDLKRWGDMQNAVQRALNDNIGGYTPVYNGAKSEVFPIPQSELDANEKLVQNPTWQ